MKTKNIKRVVKESRDHLNYLWGVAKRRVKLEIKVHFITSLICAELAKDYDEGEALWEKMKHEVGWRD